MTTPTPQPADAEIDKRIEEMDRIVEAADALKLVVTSCGISFSSYELAYAWNEFKQRVAGIVKREAVVTEDRVQRMEEALKRIADQDYDNDIDGSFTAVAARIATAALAPTSASGEVRNG